MRRVRSICFALAGALWLSAPVAPAVALTALNDHAIAIPDDRPALISDHTRAKMLWQVRRLDVE